MDFGFLKNPIILGIFAAVLTYLYFLWDVEQKRKQNPESEQPTKIGFVTPGVVGIIVWFITSTYFDNQQTVQEAVKPAIEALAVKPALEGGNKTFQLIDTDGSLGNKSVHLLTKNKIKLPTTDVFIDIAKF